MSARRPALPHLFFVEGGALAVENAVKVAFDWKSRQERAEGGREHGDKVMHLRHASMVGAVTCSASPTLSPKTDQVPEVRLAADLQSRLQTFPLADI